MIKNLKCKREMREEELEEKEEEFKPIMVEIGELEKALSEEEEVLRKEEPGESVLDKNVLLAKEK
jgi:hypothetical protein